jgi:hypothetical protein
VSYFIVTMFWFEFEFKEIDITWQSNKEGEIIYGIKEFEINWVNKDRFIDRWKRIWVNKEEDN